MFELDGDEYTLQALQESANQQGFDFDVFMGIMKKKGLSEIKSSVDLSSQQYSKPMDVITSVKYNDDTYSFFDKSDKEAVADLRELYPEFDFKQKFVGEGGGLQAVEISTKDGKHSTSFDVGIGDMFNLYGSQQYLSKKEGRDKSFKILDDFLKQHATIEGQVMSDKEKIKRREIFSKINTEKDELAVGEINDVNKRFDEGSLFEPIQETTYAITKTGLSKPQKIVTTTQPYEKELKQAEKELLFDKQQDESIIVDSNSIKERAKKLL